MRLRSTSGRRANSSASRAAGSRVSQGVVMGGHGWSSGLASVARRRWRGYQTASGRGVERTQWRTKASFAADEAADIVARLKRRMIDDALPLWSTDGWDACGGRLRRPAAPRTARADTAAPRRVLVQARQIYCYAKAAQMGWYPEGRAIALKGLEHLLAKAKAPDGRPGYVHRLTPDGAVLDAPARHLRPRLRAACARDRLRARPATRRFAPRSTRCSPSSTAICARRMAAFMEGLPVVAAAPAEPADASVRGDDRVLRCDP